ncbi:hypothetical protein V6Z11_A08G196600 [Gossypium hirsutum]
MNTSNFDHSFSNFDQTHSFPFVHHLSHLLQAQNHHVVTLRRRLKIDHHDGTGNSIAAHDDQSDYRFDTVALDGKNDRGYEQMNDLLHEAQCPSSEILAPPWHSQQ